jgi:ferredoxin
MNMNLMEVCKSYELPVKGTCGGMAMCASCHCYVDSDHQLKDASDDEEDMLDQAFLWRTIADWGVKFSCILTSKVLRLPLPLNLNK